MNLRRGNTYKIKFDVTVNETPINIDCVDKIEVSFNNEVKKYYPQDITYNDGYFYFNLSQNDTFKLKYDLEYQIRIKLVTGTIIGGEIISGELYNSLSEEEL